jgi:peptide-methionine (S)-S-oxide reductase
MNGKMYLKFVVFLALLCSLSCAKSAQNTTSVESDWTKFDSLSKKSTKKKLKNTMEQKLEKVAFGAGCFWCVEAVFQQIPGVTKVVSGYSNGNIKNPTYREVCSGLTGHAEVCELTYDPNLVSFETLLEVFWKTHDPTTLNRQGADVGTQYRSGVYFHNEAQAVLAQQWKDKLNAEKVFPNPIVTEIVAAATFYPAEDYHQQYFNQNGQEPYCQIVIKPKLEKFNKVFGDRFKK